MPYNFPLAVGEVASAKAAIESFKEQTRFDEYLAELVARKFVFNRVYEKERLDNLVAVALPQIKAHVNNALRQVVCSEDVLDSHNLNPHHRTIYVPEDTLRSRVRDIIFHVYGASADRRMVRKKETGCMQAVTFVINTRITIKV